MKRPLLYILLGLCAGIVAASYFDLNIFEILTFFVLLMAVLYIFVLKMKSAVIFTMPVFFMIGVVLYTNAANVNLVLEPHCLNKSKLTVTGTVTESSAASDGYVYRLKINSYENEDEDISIPFYLEKNIDLRWKCGSKLYVGTDVDVTGTVYSFTDKYNPSDFNSKLYYKIRNYDYGINSDEYVIKKINYNIFSYFTEIRDDMLNVFDTILTQEHSGILKAIILGDKSGLSENIKNTYRNIGIYHFLAISGLHISVLAGTLFWLLKKINYTFALVMVSAFLFVYCFITGFSISVVRASVMMLICAVAPMLGKDYDLLCGAGITAVILLLFRPLYLFDVGFQYSFGAVFGIGFAADAFAEYKNKAVNNLPAAFGASFMTKPITMAYMYKFNVIDTFINILLIPVMSYIVIMGFAVGIIGCINIEAGKYAGCVLMSVLDLFNDLCKIIETFPICSYVIKAPDILEIILIYMGLFFIYWLIKCKNIMGAGCLFVLCVVLASFMNKDFTEFQADFMYVGQADCAIVRTADKTIMVDCGGSEFDEIGKDNGKYVAMPYINYCGRDSIDAVFISHADTDHIKGVLDIIGNMPIGKIYLGEIIEENQHYETLINMAKENNIPVEFLKAGDNFKIGDMYIDVFSPDVDVHYDDYNDASMVFSIAYKEMDLLFTGDIYSDTEERIMEYGIPSGCILKVPHHGSKYSSSAEFLQILSPYYSVISVKENNSYGHPHEETLERYKQLKLDYGITSESGMISTAYRGGRIYIEKYRQ